MLFIASGTLEAADWIAENVDWNTCSTVPATADANGLMALISAEIVWNALDSETVRWMEFLRASIPVFAFSAVEDKIPRALSFAASASDFIWDAADWIGEISSFIFVSRFCKAVPAALFWNACIICSICVFIFWIVGDAAVHCWNPSARAAISSFADAAAVFTGCMLLLSFSAMLSAFFVTVLILLTKPLMSAVIFADSV